jgi:hypothetical protein
LLGFELALVAIALTSSAAAGLVPLIQREDRRFPASPERRALFGTLLLDATLQWICIARVAAGDADAAWVASFILVLAANIIVGGYLLVRGFALPNLVRWGGIALLLALEPAMLSFVIFALAGAGSI